MVNKVYNTALSTRRLLPRGTSSDIWAKVSPNFSGIARPDGVATSISHAMDRQNRLGKCTLWVRDDDEYGFNFRNNQTVIHLTEAKIAADRKRSKKDVPSWSVVVC